MSNKYRPRNITPGTWRRMIQAYDELLERRGIAESALSDAKVRKLRAAPGGSLAGWLDREEQLICSHRNVNLEAFRASRPLLELERFERAGGKR